MGLSRSIAAKWKNTQTNPSAEVLPRIADYFGVTTDYLLGSEKEKAPTPEGERRIVDKDIMFAFWGDSPEMDKDDLEDVRRYAEFVRQRKKDKQ